MAFKNNLVRARKRAGLTQEEVGSGLGISSQAVSQWERGETVPELSRIPKIARILKVSEGALLSEEDTDFDAPSFEAEAPDESGPRMVPIIGYVGAGAQTHTYAVPAGQLDEVEAPPGATEKTVAVEIRGESLGTLFDRWIVLYDAVESPVTSDLIGRLCVIGTADERVLIKKIRRGKNGLYNLESNTEPTMRDVAIIWAAKVKHMVPR